VVRREAGAARKSKSPGKSPRSSPTSSARSHPRQRVVPNAALQPVLEAAAASAMGVALKQAEVVQEQHLLQADRRLTNAIHELHRAREERLALLGHSRQFQEEDFDNSIGIKTPPLHISAKRLAKGTARNGWETGWTDWAFRRRS